MFGRVVVDPQYVCYQSELQKAKKIIGDNLSEDKDFPKEESLKLLDIGDRIAALDIADEYKKQYYLILHKHPQQIFSELKNDFLSKAGLSLSLRRT